MDRLLLAMAFCVAFALLVMVVLLVAQRGSVPSLPGEDEYWVNEDGTPRTWD